MRIENLFKRYLKEIGIFPLKESKKSINYMKQYANVAYPFNAFRWDVTEEGYLFWFERALNWCIFFYNNCDNIDEEELEEYEITKLYLCVRIRRLLVYYLNDEEELIVKKLKCYKEAEDILNKNGMPID